jgi:hypothetical protein
VARLDSRRSSAREPPVPDRSSSASRASFAAQREQLSVLRAFVPSEEDHRRRTAARRLAARSFVASVKGAHQTAARRLARSFVASIREPARLQLGAGKKSTADSSSSHTMEMKLWCCRCVASPCRYRWRHSRHRCRR